MIKLSLFVSVIAWLLGIVFLLFVLSLIYSLIKYLNAKTELTYRQTEKCEFMLFSEK